jgi:hypothetical protein
MDDSSEQLAAAHERKMSTYTPLLETLQAYLDEGWQVEIFPWVVCICSLVSSAVIKSCLEFLAILQQRWEWIIEDVAKESVKTFNSQHLWCNTLKLGPRSRGLHTTRNVAGARSTRNEVFDADDLGRACNRIWKWWSDEDIDEKHRRWKQMEKTKLKRGWWSKDKWEDNVWQRWPWRTDYLFLIIERRERQGEEMEGVDEGYKWRATFLEKR